MINKKRILYVGPFDTKGVFQGGICTVVNSAYEYFISTNNDAVELIPSNTCRIFRKQTSQGRFCFENIYNSFKLFRDISSDARESCADVIYYNSSCGIPLLKDLLILKYAQIRNECEAVVHIHFADSDKILPNNFILRNLTLGILKSLDKVIFLSEITRKAFINLGLEERKTSTLYNFHSYEVSWEIISNKIAEIRNKKVLDIVFLGSINKRKGIMDLLVALQNVKIPYILHICGAVTDESIKDEFSSLVKALPSESVVIHGFIKDPQKLDLLLKCDVMVLPSYGEGFPMVLVEGMAAGCALITTDVGAVVEVFDERNGCIFKPGDIKSIVDAIERSQDINYLSKICMHNYEQSKQYSVRAFVENLLRFV